MKIISDLHIHSRYSQACSRNINIELLKFKGSNFLEHDYWKSNSNTKTLAAKLFFFNLW